MTTTAAVSTTPLPVVGPGTPRGRSVWTWWALTRALCLLAVIASERVGSTAPIFGLAGDVGQVYGVAAGHIHAGLVPYRDFAFEYPPGTLPFLLPWPRLGPDLYLLAYACEMLVVDALILRALRRSDGPWATDASMLWVFGVALMLGLPLSRNDLPSCLAAVVGLLAYVRGRHLFGALALALGSVAKVWPVTVLTVTAVVVPRAARSAVVALAAVGAAALLPLVAVGALPGLWHDVVGYHSGRGVEVEAAAALPTLLWGALTDRNVSLTGDHASTNLAHSTGLATICTILGVLAIVAVVALGLRVRARLGRVPAAELTALASLVVASSLIAAKVFSAQYVVWLVAVACVGRAYGGVDRLEGRIVLGAVLATTLVYPFNFFLIGDGGMSGLVPATLLLVRDIALAVLVMRWTMRLLAVPR